MIRRIFAYLLAVAAVAVLFSKCDTIDPPYKENTGVTAGDACVFPTDTSPVYRKILIEDYTGHLCGNCPAGANEIYNVLKPLYGDTLISIAVHSNPINFTGVCPLDNPYPNPGSPPLPSTAYSADYRTPSGLTWFDDFGFSGIPHGMVNRTPYNSSTVLSIGNWNPAISILTGTPAEMKLQIINTYNSSSGELNTCIKTTFLTNTTGNFNLSAVLTEDSIVDWQYDYSLPNSPPLYQNDSDFVQHHVMRGTLNTTYGDEIKAGTVLTGDTAVKSYKINLLSLPTAINSTNPVLNIGHCYVIAFVFDATTKEVFQVEEEKVE